MESVRVAEADPTWPPGPLPIDPAPLALVLLALGTGLALDIGMRGGVHNGIVGIGIVLIAGALVTSHRVERTAARWLAASALLPAGYLVVRASPWLAASNLAAVIALITLAVSFSRSGSLRDTPPMAVVGRASAAAGRAVMGPILLRQVVPKSGGRVAQHGTRVTRALAIAVPMLAVVIALLASADAVFKDMVVPHVRLGEVSGHVTLITVFAVMALGIAAAAMGDAQPKVRTGRFEALEIIVMLSLAVAVLALFAVAQLVALSDAGHRLVIQAGLTPAEYARSGFFQLCWATAFLVAFLAIARGLAAPGVYDRPAVRVLAGAVPLLAIGLVVVSLRRMALYDAAFGMTMLRLWVIGAAIWMGLLLAMVAVRNAGVGHARNWLVAGAGATALALIMVANVANPEAFVVHHNVTRAEHGHALDPGYLGTLSDDAVPAVVAAIERSPSHALRDELRRALSCRPRPIGVSALNVATIRAGDARDRVCSSRPPSGGWVR